MRWKIERWTSEVYPGDQNLFSAYSKLSSRELPIVVAASLDVALAELCIKRLRNYESESISFMGVNGDGRAPAATFGSRIQLALLLGIITTEDAEILRDLKTLRNIFAHKVNADFLDPFVLRILKSLYSKWEGQTEKLIESGFLPGSTDGLKELEQNMDNCNEASEALILVIFSVYQAYFSRISQRVTRITRAF